MTKFDEKIAEPDEIYDWCIKEYSSKNPVTKILINRFYKTLEKMLKEIKPELSNILEIGCGAGESTLRIQPMISGIKYDATEYDYRYIEAIKKRNLPIDVSQEDVYQIKKPDSSYDCVLMLEVLEHLENISKAISELYRVSSKYVIISVPNEPLWRISNLLRCKYVYDFGNTPGHINHFNKRRLDLLLRPYSSKTKFCLSFPWIIVLAEK